MAANNTIEKVLMTTLEQFEKFENPADFKVVKDDSKKMDELVGIIRNAAEEYLQLEQIPGLDTNPDELGKRLPPHRIEMIKEGLTIPTYKINITKRGAGGNHSVDITRDGKPFKPSRELITLEDVDSTKVLQYAIVSLWRPYY